MITNNGERKPNSGASKAAQANKRAQEQGKRRTEAERKKQANASTATKAATSTPSVSASTASSGTLTTPGPISQARHNSRRSIDVSGKTARSGFSVRAGCFLYRLYRTANRPRRAGIRDMTSSKSNPSTQQAMASPMPTVKAL